MAKLVWSEEAFNDLDDITDFILKDSARYAQIVGEALLTAAKEAFEEPYVGRMVPELGQKQVREKLVYSYRLIYRLSGEEVRIIALVNGARLLTPIVDSRL